MSEERDVPHTSLLCTLLAELPRISNEIMDMLRSSESSRIYERLL